MNWEERGKVAGNEVHLKMLAFLGAMLLGVLGPDSQVDAQIAGLPGSVCTR